MQIRVSRTMLSRSEQKGMIKGERAIDGENKGLEKRSGKRGRMPTEKSFHKQQHHSDHCNCGAFLL